MKINIEREGKYAHSQCMVVLHTHTWSVGRNSSLQKLLPPLPPCHWILVPDEYCTKISNEIRTSSEVTKPVMNIFSLRYDGRNTTKNPTIKYFKL